jgi:hypothetical protein
MNRSQQAGSNGGMMKIRGLQRYHFLLAASALMLSLFISLLQWVMGGVQVYKAYYPLK